MAERAVEEDSKDLPTCLCCGIKPKLGFFVVQKLLLGCSFLFRMMWQKHLLRFALMPLSNSFEQFVVVVSLLWVHLLL